MLIVLAGSPVAAPLEAGGGEEAEAEVNLAYMLALMTLTMRCTSSSLT